LDVRIDHNFGQSDTINGFYSHAKNDSSTPSVLGGVLEGGGGTTIQTVNFRVGKLYACVFSTLTNEFRLGYTKEDLSS